MNDANALLETNDRRPAQLFVSTALGTWTTDQPEVFARDVQINDTAYRKLDPEYFAWLRAKMTAARTVAQSGQLPIDAFNQLRSRFNAVQTYAVEHFGEPRLREAVLALNMRLYTPPTAEPTASLPVRGLACQDVHDRSASLDVSPAAAAQVDEIRDRALARGWTYDRLYRVPETHRSGISVSGGLVCYLRDGWRIGEVTRQFIETIGPPPLAVRQCFYNPDVDQPWIRKVGRPQEF